MNKQIMLEFAAEWKQTPLFINHMKNKAELLSLNLMKPSFDHQDLSVWHWHHHRAKLLLSDFLLSLIQWLMFGSVLESELEHVLLELRSAAVKPAEFRMWSCQGTSAEHFISQVSRDKNPPLLITQSFLHTRRLCLKKRHIQRSYKLGCICKSV